MEYASGFGRRAPLKLYNIVRLQHMVKQWRRVAQLSKKRLHHVLAKSLSNSSFEYTLINTNTNTNNNNNNMLVPKKGHIAVYVGEERRRFVVPVRLLNHPAFHNLLLMAEEEFQFHYHGGGLTIPCDVTFFEQFVLPLLDQGCQYNSTRASTSSFAINREQGGYQGVVSEVPAQLPPPPNNHYCSNILDSTYIHIPSPLRTRA